MKAELTPDQKRELRGMMAVAGAIARKAHTNGIIQGNYYLWENTEDDSLDASAINYAHSLTRAYYLAHPGQGVKEVQEKPQLPEPLAHTLNTVFVRPPWQPISC